MMTHRRSFLLALGAAASLPWIVAPAMAQSGPEAARFIRSVGDQLVAIVNGPGSAEQKRQELARAIDSYVDVDGVARFCLGRFWRVATPQQRRDYQDLFRKVLIGSISSRIGEYEGVHFTLGRTTPRAEGQSVATTLSGPKRTPTEIDWVVSQVGGSPKIIDVIAEGTSLRLTQRSDYASFIVRHNDSVQALVDAMRRQVSSAAG
jgi:phospholipid transport system substrate-binding protein